MGKRRWLRALCAGLLAGATMAAAQVTPATADLARSLTQQMAAKQFNAVTRRFDPTMSAALPAPKLAQIWTSLTQRAGAFQSISGVTTQQDRG